jgi:glycerol kinase
VYILAIAQGTSSTKAIVFSAEGRRAAGASAALDTRYTPDGRAEQDPEAIYRSVLDSVAACMQKLESESRIRRSEIACAGIANQQETFVLWDEKGQLHDAVVWQCKRSVDICRQLEKAGVEPEIRERTGLTRGRVHATDQTNASRTLLYNIHHLDWDGKLAEILGASLLRLPEVYPSAHRFAESTFAGIFDTPVPITGMIGDSHAALFGERCYRPGEAKATLGTGSSILIDAGPAEIARSVEDTGGVCLVPAHAGLGAPFWKMDAKGAVVGLTFATSRAHLLRAALECIPYQIRAIVDAVAEETGVRCLSIRAERVREPAPSVSGSSPAESGCLTWRRQVDALVDA